MSKNCTHAQALLKIPQRLLAFKKAPSLMSSARRAAEPTLPETWHFACFTFEERESCMKKRLFPAGSPAVAHVTAILAGVALFGCAPQNKTTPVQTTDPMSALMSAASAGTSSIGDPGWNCPDQANVTLANNIEPGGGYGYAGNGFFTVCTPSNAGANPTRFQVTGATTAAALCFYPMTFGGNGIPTLIGTPQCENVTGGTLTVSFTGLTTNMNYMVIVDANETNAMNACLGSTSPCPSYSEGFVQ